MIYTKEGGSRRTAIEAVIAALEYRDDNVSRYPTHQKFDDENFIGRIRFIVRQIQGDAIAAAMDETGALAAEFRATISDQRAA